MVPPAALRWRLPRAPAPRLHSPSKSSSSTAVTCSLTWQNLRVRPTASSPLVSGNITKTGTSTLAAVTNSGTSFGSLVELGPLVRLAIRTQPSPTATAGTVTNQVIVNVSTAASASPAYLLGINALTKRDGDQFYRQPWLYLSCRAHRSPPREQYPLASFGPDRGKRRRTGSVYRHQPAARASLLPGGLAIGKRFKVLRIARGGKRKAQGPGRLPLTAFRLPHCPIQYSQSKSQTPGNPLGLIPTFHRQSIRGVA